MLQKCIGKDALSGESGKERIEDAAFFGSILEGKVKSFCGFLCGSRSIGAGEVA